MCDPCSLFYGKIRQRLTPLTEADAKKPRSSSTHEKEDLFSHLHLNVSDEAFDLYDGLSRYFDDVVELEGTKKRMEVTLVDLPPLLQIQLQVGFFAEAPYTVLISFVARTIRPRDTAAVQVSGLRQVWRDSLLGPLLG